MLALAHKISGIQLKINTGLSIATMYTHQNSTSSHFTKKRLSIIYTQIKICTMSFYKLQKIIIPNTTPPQHQTTEKNSYYQYTICHRSTRENIL